VYRRTDNDVSIKILKSIASKSTWRIMPWVQREYSLDQNADKKNLVFHHFGRFSLPLRHGNLKKRKFYVISAKLRLRVEKALYRHRGG